MPHFPNKPHQTTSIALVQEQVIQRCRDVRRRRCSCDAKYERTIRHSYCEEFRERVFRAQRTATWLTLLFLILAAAVPRSVQAEEMTGGGYIIKMGSINISGGSKTGPKIKLTDSVGQTLQGRFEGDGYRASIGFQFLPVSEPFSFTISTDKIDFGTIKPGVFASTGLDLTVNASSVPGYTVSAIEDHPLTAKPDNSIADAACDPSRKCTPNQAAPWTSSLAYGFGYNLTGADVDTDQFVDATYFRPFADNGKNQNPVAIMARHSNGQTAKAKLTLQVNVPPTQASGAYQNAIQFIALPSF